MKRNIQEKGITLIALVITIIVLLILAGASLKMLAGEDEGIFKKAKGAVDKSENAGWQEEIEFAIEDLKTAYYENKKGKTLEVYLIEKLTEGIITSKGEVKLDGPNLKMGDNIIGTYANGAVTITKGGTAGGSGNAESITAKITSANYGEYIDLGTNIFGEKPTLEGEEEPIPADWRILYKGKNEAEEDIVIAILADYLPMAQRGELEGDGGYIVFASEGRDVLIDELKNETNWRELLDGSKVAGAAVAGTVDLPTWLASWREKNDLQLYPFGDEAGGYMVGTSEEDRENGYSVSGDSGYENSLYFPHRSSDEWNGAYGYWLASPAEIGPLYVMKVHNSGRIEFTQFDNAGCGVRPVVVLPASVLVQQDTSTGVWKVP